MQEVTMQHSGKTVKTTLNAMKAVSGGFKVTEVEKTLPDLEAQCQRAIDAQASFTDACKATAERSGIEPGVLKSFVSAKVKDTLEKQRTKAEQMQLLLEEVG